MGARSPVKDLLDATPDGLRRSAFREAFAVRTPVSGTVGLESGLGASSPVNDLPVATPDGLRRSAFREGFAVRTRVFGKVDLKTVGRKISGEGFASCDTGRLAPFRF